jgi:hypothetical protein
LGEWLQELAARDLPTQSFDVILVDDGGTEPLEETPAPFRERVAIRLFTSKAPRLRGGEAVWN